MNLSVIIPNYNGEILLKKNLPKVIEAVRSYKDGWVEIIIADDCSVDNSKSEAEKIFSGIKKDNIKGIFVENHNKLDRGFSKNVNRGVRDSTGDILILLNTDVAPYQNFLSPLIKHFERHDVFAVGCMDESFENGKKILRGRGIGSFRRGFLIHKKGEVEKSGTLWVSGGSGAFRKEIWDKLKGLDNLYSPFYWEDIDISYRAQKSGYKIIFEPESIVTHTHNEGVIKKEFDSNFVKKIAYRNQFIFMWKNITDLDLLVKHILWLPYHFFKAMISSDWQLFGGFLQAFTCSAKIMKARRSAKKMFIKRDSEVIKSYV